VILEIRMSDSSATRKIVLGLGNTLNSDEGLGVQAVKQLEARLGKLASQLEFLDGGVLGLNLLPWVEEASHLLVLDAVNAHKKPGTLIELKRDEIPLYSGIKLSDHQVTFQEVLGLAQFRNHLPEHLHLIGIQPADLSIGVDLSPIVSATMPRMLARALVVLREWTLIDKEYTMKKIAFPTEDGETISRHLGRAPWFIIASLDESNHIVFEEREKPHHGTTEEDSQHDATGHRMSHQVMFAPIADCQVLISGGMGEPAYQNALSLGLEVILPAEPSIQKALDAYQSGQLESDMRRIHKH
jgi:hydrogenase maturation protease